MSGRLPTFVLLPLPAHAACGDASAILVQNAEPSVTIRTEPTRHSDLHVLSERGEESEEPVRRETGQLPSGKIRNIRLVHPEELCGLNLPEAAAFDDGRDARGDLRLDEALRTLLEAEVLEDVSGASLHGNHGP